VVHIKIFIAVILCNTFYTVSHFMYHLCLNFVLCNLVGQNCVNNPNVDQRGSVTIGDGRQVIVPNSKFDCNGRITGIRASMALGGQDGGFPTIQIWHPLSLDSGVYNRSGQVQVTGGNQKSQYYSFNLSLNNNDQIEFQSNDVLGYYQPANPQRRIWSIVTKEYTSYSNDVNNPGNMIDVNNANIETQRQPLIEVTFGKFMPSCIK